MFISVHTPITNFYRTIYVDRIQRLSSWVSKYSSSDVVDEVCQNTLKAIAAGTLENFRHSNRLARIVRKAEAWQKFTSGWENRVLQLFGVGDEIVRTRELLRRLSVMEASYGEIDLLAKADPMLLIAMHGKRQLCYQSTL